MIIYHQLFRVKTHISGVECLVANTDYCITWSPFSASVFRWLLIEPDYCMPARTIVLLHSWGLILIGVIGVRFLGRIPDGYHVQQMGPSKYTTTY